jgi:hypothetical protein
MGYMKQKGIEIDDLYSIINLDDNGDMKIDHEICVDLAENNINLIVECIGEEDLEYVKEVIKDTYDIVKIENHEQYNDIKLVYVKEKSYERNNDVDLEYTLADPLSK